MIQRPILPATIFALVPTAAWAHGDHYGLHGLIHVLSEPLHLGLVLLVILGAALLGPRIKAFVTTRVVARKIRRD